MKLINVAKKYTAPAAVVGSLVLSSSAFASIEESINTAVTTGQSNYTLVVVGLIGLAAIGFGLRMIIGAMR